MEEKDLCNHHKNLDKCFVLVVVVAAAAYLKRIGFTFPDSKHPHVDG